MNFNKYSIKFTNQVYIFLKYRLKESKIFFFLRQYKSLILLFTKSLKETSNNIENNFDILLYLTDADYGLEIENKKYSQLIDSLAFDLDLLGYKYAILRHWQSKIDEKYLYRKTHPINLKFLKYFIKNCFKFKTISSVLINTWQDVLKSFEYKLIIGIQPDDYLSEASLKLKKPLIDLQHGLVLEDPLQPFQCYYNYLWKKEKSKKRPDNFLGIFKHNVNMISLRNKSKTSIYYLGSPYLANKELIENTKNNYKYSDKIFRVLFTQQAFFGKLWGFGDVDIDGKWTKQGIPEGIIKAIQNSPKNLHWTIRLHPSNSIIEEKKIKETFNSINQGSNSILSFSSREIPISVELMHTDLLINWCSSCTNEAAELGIKTIILDQRDCAKSGFQKEHNDGLVFFRNNDMNEILKFINECSSEFRNKEKFYNTYRKNYLNRLENYLGGLIDAK